MSNKPSKNTTGKARCPHCGEVIRMSGETPEIILYFHAMEDEDGGCYEAISNLGIVEPTNADNTDIAGNSETDVQAEPEILAVQSEEICTVNTVVAEAETVEIVAEEPMTTADNNPVLACARCGQIFKTASGLKSHERADKCNVVGETALDKLERLLSKLSEGVHGLVDDVHETMKAEAALAMKVSNAKFRIDGLKNAISDLESLPEGYRPDGLIAKKKSQFREAVTLYAEILSDPAVARGMSAAALVEKDKVVVAAQKEASEVKSRPSKDNPDDLEYLSEQRERFNQLLAGELFLHSKKFGKESFAARSWLALMVEAKQAGIPAYERSWASIQHLTEVVFGKMCEQYSFGAVKVRSEKSDAVVGPNGELTILPITTTRDEVPADFRAFHTMLKRMVGALYNQPKKGAEVAANEIGYGLKSKAEEMGREYYSFSHRINNSKLAEKSGLAAELVRVGVAKGDPKSLQAGNRSRSGK